MKPQLIMKLRLSVPGLYWALRRFPSRNRLPGYLGFSTAKRFCLPSAYLSPETCVCSFTSRLSRVPSTHSHTCALSVLENLHTTVVLTLILRLFASFVGTRTKLRHKNSKPRLHEEVDRKARNVNDP